jgi:predicted O-methyltransferase YrrM
MDKKVNGVDYAAIGPDDVRVGVNGNSPLKRFLDHKIHYQDLLAGVVRQVRPEVMIETGVESGFSSEHFLTAMDSVGAGHLFSCDPQPSGFYDSYPIVHPRFTFIREPSFTALDKIFKATGRVDIFLHDSDHSYGVMAWEFEWAWKHVRKGGVIASDDCGWGEAPQPGMEHVAHHAWDNFCARHHVTHLRQKINNAEMFVKPC